MLLNANIALLSGKIALVPYTAQHVQLYHEWMQDPILRDATASESLSLEDEYAMQISWREDDDKLTFIICRIDEGLWRDRRGVAAGEIDDEAQMIGDINLFLSLDNEQEQLVLGEIELMIADRDSRRCGYGKAALLAFLQYIRVHEQQILQRYAESPGRQPCGHSTGFAYLRVKINKENKASIALFEHAGFELVTSEPNYFGELELRSTTYGHTSGTLPLREVRYEYAEEA